MMKIYSIALLLPGVLMSASLHAQTSPPKDLPASIVFNYVRTLEAVAPETDGTLLLTRPLKDVKMATQYVDGLGRPIQTVIKQGSMETGAAATDLVSPVMYDIYGREQYKLLPFAANNAAANPSVSDGGIKLNVLAQQQAFMQQQYGAQGETVFYEKTNFELSPLHRAEKIMAPGNSWAGSNRGVEIKYWMNTNLDSVRRWECENAVNTFGTYSSPGEYAAGQLLKNVMVDEHGRQVVEFKDKEGKVIMKKVQLTAAADNGSGTGHSGWLCTYYIYDEFNNLRCVIQPEGVKQLAVGSWQLTATILAEQSFRYEYDARNRMIIKKVPGTGEIYMVYDARDRLVMIQDANMRFPPSGGQPQWMVTKYDALNRPVETGKWTNSSSLATHLSAAYSSIDYPSTTTDYEMLTLAHYDDYTGLPAELSDHLTTWNSNFSATDNNNWPYPQLPQKSNVTKGLVTWTQTKILGTANFINTVSYYDDKGRVIQTQSTNITGGTDINTTQYTWAGQPLVTVHRQQTLSLSGGAPQEHIVITKMQYDDMGRVLTIRKAASGNIGGAIISKPEQLIVSNKYDKLGQLKEKQLGAGPGTPLYQAAGWLRYDYNIRGWVLGMNREFVRDASPAGCFFGFELGYDKRTQAESVLSPGGGGSFQYNGNINGMVWKSIGDNEKRKYDFTYDGANRLLKADFAQYTGGTFNQGAGVNYDMKMGDGNDVNTAYDANGNIKQLQQWGLKIGSSVQIDNLHYAYQPGSNKLAGVAEYASEGTPPTGGGPGGLGDFKDGTTGGDDYSYDDNGNLVMDMNKNISSITYNHLNLPSVITVSSRSGGGTISYTYDAAGNKLKKVVTEAGQPAKTTVYCDLAMYQDDTLQFIVQEEGRVRLKVLPDQEYKLVFDYMLKDHLGNVRMVLTEEQHTDAYPPASMEDAAATTEELFYANVNTTRAGLPAGYPTDNYTNPNEKVAKLLANAPEGTAVGPSIVLKVMAGDAFNLRVSSFWESSNDLGLPVDPLNSIVENLNHSIGHLQGGHVNTNDPAVTSGLMEGVINFLGQQGQGTDPAKPPAFINWILFDEQFNYAGGSSGFAQVGAAGELTVHTFTNLPVHKSGYLYIYLSNADPDKPVYYDNLQVTHLRGPILEETHYYPWGLTMKGISSKALKTNYAESKKKFINQELDDDLGIDLYAFRYRNHDPQIGRFIQIDPLAAQYAYNSTYAYAENKPINGIDLEGLEWLPINKDGQAVKPESKEEINGYTWAGYDVNPETGEKTPKAGTVAQAYTFGIKGRTTLGVDKNGNASQIWESYSSISTGDAASDKKIATLHPSIQDKVKAFILKTDNRFGIKLRVTDGFRTIAQQNSLYAQGRRGIKGEPTVTGAKGGQSNHNYGLAIDVVPMVNGTANYSSSQYPLIGRIGESVGLGWGGRFRSVDMPHFEDFKGYSIGQLRTMPKDEKGLPVLPEQ